LAEALTFPFHPSAWKERGADVKKTETKWWVVALWVVLAAVLVGLLLAGGMGGLFPTE
jgi:hypothetical protein